VSRKPDLTFNGIPIFFDEDVPEDTFYIFSNSLDAKRQRVLDRILSGVKESTRDAQVPELRK
jgi:hypothetical protein